jgi:YVTN family beta-propeller protein
MSDPFVLHERLGRGAMGEVYRATDTATGMTVALKLLYAHLASDPAYRERFAREAELASRIDSPHVVKVLGYGIRDERPYLALEYVEGETLRDAAAAHGPYAWPEARDLTAQVASGLAAVHAAGVLHRDLKPSNILLTPDGVAKITDFGIAKGLDLTALTASSTVLGTPTYLAPEGPRDERSDLYGLGIIAYELLAGAPPFTGDSHQDVILAHVRTAPDLRRIPPEARPIVGALLAKDPRARPQSAAAVLAALAPPVAPPPKPAKPRPAPKPRPVPVRDRTPTPHPVARPPRDPTARSRTPLLAGAGLAGFAVLVLGVALAAGVLPPKASGSGSPVAVVTSSPSATVVPKPSATAVPTAVPTPTPRPAISSASYPVGTHPYNVAFDGASIWVANAGSNNATKLDPATGAIIGTYPVGTTPVGIAFDGQTVWVSNTGSNNVTKLTAATGAVVGTLQVGTYPGALAFDGTNVWVANVASGTLTKIRAATGTVVGTYSLGSAPDLIAVGGANVWVAMSSAGEVLKVRAADGVVLARYRVGNRPDGLVFDGTSLWVTESTAGTVAKLNPTSGALEGTYAVGNHPVALAFYGGRLWVSNWGSNNVMTVDPVTGDLEGTYPVGANPNGMSFDGASVWVANTNSNTVTKLTF